MSTTTTEVSRRVNYPIFMFNEVVKRNTIVPPNRYLNIVLNHPHSTSQNPNSIYFHYLLKRKNRVIYAPAAF